MTERDKIQIAILRTAGKSISTIALELSLSVNTVKSYCRRNGIEPGKKDVCLNCGKTIDTSQAKNKRFCSDRCRLIHWRRTHTEKRTSYPCICEFCGNTFLSVSNKHRKYCSRVCYASARFGKVDLHG